MINAATKNNQKLIVFTDNRQDAAFQAGWMQDHARRYRFRHLIYQFLQSNDHPVSVGDLVDHLQKTLLADKSLANVLAPEVFELQKPEEYGNKFFVELNYYLRIQILRELGTSFNQKEGLECWGLMKTEYFGIGSQNPWIIDYAKTLGITVSELAEGISSLIDVFRRNRYLYDSGAPIYSKSWFEGDYEIQQGYLPLITGVTNKPIPPKGIVESAAVKTTYQVTFRAKKGQSLPENLISKWKIEDKQIKEKFLKDLWVFLTDNAKILVPVNLMGKNGKILEANVYQLNVSKIGLSAYWGSYQCNICHRIHTRTSPHNVCTAMHCKGTITFKIPSKDNYNIDLLSGEFSMLKPHEHTAQVPAEIREKIVEPEFKKSNGKYNTLVATPTLELGVDIGALDMVLMRNMPPSPANYWQRAGRAGRRHHLAVIYTYSRRSKHDLYYFNEPTFMLNGVISTPKFNLHNEVMVRKHIHAVILSELLRIIQSSALPDSFDVKDVSIIQNILGKAFPTFIRQFLFDASGNYLLKPVNIDIFDSFITSHSDHLVKTVKIVFEQNWPEEDKSIITNNLLTQYVGQSCSYLQEIINLLHSRLLWAVHVQDKYINYQSQRLLKPEEEKILYRCKNFIKALNQENKDNYTLNVLANEGYLPGYGLYDTGIKAFANMSFIGGTHKPDFELSRPPFIALREFVPGNLIYANGGRFRNVLYHLQLDSNTSTYKNVQVNVEKKILNILSDPSGQAQYSDEKSKTLFSIPLSDSDVQYISRISDEEVNRFQLSVVLLGKLAKGRRGGKVFSAGMNSISLMYGQKINLFNIGPTEKINTQLGFPVCTVCGATRSPFSSEAEFTHFKEFHKERCGREPEFVAFHAEDKVDGILIHGLPDDTAAINLGEGIIIGACAKLEMDRNDLHSVIYQDNDDTVKLFIYDPMPGGSGLLDQIIAHWKNIIEIAIQNLNNCSNNCDDSCYNCMRTYFNAFYHDILNRNTAAKLLLEYAMDLTFEYDLEPEQEIQENTGENKGTNKGEIDLVSILIQYGFPTFDTQHRISIGPPYNSTVPDLYYEDEVKDIRLTIYLDGLSKKIHGSEDRRKVDVLIRQQLEALGYDVIEIAYSDLSDPEALKLSLKRIAAKLKRRDIMDKIK